MKSTKVTRLCILALMIALEIILTRFLSVNTMFLRIGFGFLPIAMIGIMYGPIWSAAAYAVGDLIGAILFPIGPYFPGFTLTAFLTGLVFGLVLYRHPVTFRRSLIGAFIVVLLLDTGLNTLWLSILYGDAFLALLPARILKGILAIPVEALLIPFIWNNVFVKIPNIHIQTR